MSISQSAAAQQPSAALKPSNVMRFDVLDALRGLCALLVALYHFQAGGYLSELALVKNGWLFVDYFFVLSGFVIAHSYGERLATGKVSIGRFMGLRMGRIFPLHIAVLLGLIAMEVVLIIFSDSLSQYVSRDVFSGSRDPMALLQSVFLLQAFGFPGGEGWNIPAWSIAAEMWTYLLFSVIFLAPRRAMLLISAVLITLSLVWMLVVHDDLHITFQGGFIRCVFGFALGVVTYHAFTRFGGIGGSMWELIVVAVVLAYVSVAEEWVTFAAPFLFSGMIFVLASQRGIVSRILSMSGFQKLGLVSYSIYMIHFVVQGRLGEVLQVAKIVDVSVNERGGTEIDASPLVGDAITLAMLAILIAASLISYYVIEKPGRDLSRKFLSSPKVVDPAPDGWKEAAGK